MTKLVLGTAQFGSGYGITNRLNRIPNPELRKIIDVAVSGIDLIDTAPDYGDAQARLGALVPEHPIQYVSKFTLPPAPSMPQPEQLFLETLATLGVSKLYGLMFHGVDDLRDVRADAAWAALRRAREEGRVDRIGASIYDADDLEVVYERFSDIDLIQIPGNILDRRLLDHPILRSMQSSGVEVHVRSVYLQGLLLSAPDDAPTYFRELEPTLSRLRAFARSNGLTVMDLALAYLKNHANVDAVLVGAVSAVELKQTLASWNQLPEAIPSFNDFSIPHHLLDPRTWPARGNQS